MSQPVQVANPKAQYLRFKEEILEAMRDVCERGAYILGPSVKAFEESFAAFIGVKHCVGVASGTDALAIALLAGGVGPGDEVITVSHSAVATAAAIEQIGAVPVFADIETRSRCLDPASLEGLLGARTKALVPVHIYGQPADLTRIISFARKHNLLVVEDCAQAHGAMIGDRRVGSFGDLSAFSFYPTKNLGALGDGGAVCANASAPAERARLLHQYGWKERYVSAIRGVNSRLDEMQAAILSIKLRSLEGDNARRRQISEFYRSKISDASLAAPAQIQGTTAVVHLFVVETESREKFRNFMQEHGVMTALHYPQAIHQQPAYAGRLRGGDNLPHTEALYRRLVSLPMYPELTDGEVERVGEALRLWSNKAGA